MSIGHARNLGIFVSPAFSMSHTTLANRHYQHTTMPSRVARSAVSIAKPKTAKNKNRKRQLDAYSIASHSAPDTQKVRQHRLGESIGEEPRSKRRRLQDDEEEQSVDEEHRTQSRNVTKRTGTGAQDVEEGSDSEGNEWTLGGLAEDDEDSDLDSDEAFGESDEEKFEGFTFRGSSSGAKKVKKRKIPINEDEDDEDIDLDEIERESDHDKGQEDDFGNEGVDLATMLDDRDEEQLGGNDHTARDMGESSDEDESDEDEDERDTESGNDDAESDLDNEEAVARNQDFLSGLDPQSEARKPKKTTDNSNVSMEELLADLGEARKQADEVVKPKKKRNRVDKLAAPLPKRQQDRLDRKVATEKAKEQLDRWRDTVIQSRRAEFLSFPLRNSDEVEPVGKDRFVPSNQEAPQTELEENIRKIMEESGMASKPGAAGQEDEETALIKAEELATNHLPIEDVLRRRAELRRTRDLLFREEIKAKRIAKIKSKSYRRVHRKERQRNEEKERALLNPEGLDLPMDEDEKERADRRRAEARMGARHKDSKWARSLKATGRTVWDDGARDSVQEQARREEELRRRIAGRDVEDEDASFHSEDDGDNSGDEEDEPAMLKQLERFSQDGKDGRDGAGVQKGLGAMKFMRAADERRRAQNDETVESIRKDLAGEESEDEEQEEGLGRAIFGPRPSEDRKPVAEQKRPELEEGERSDNDDGFIGFDDDEGDMTARRQSEQSKQRPNGILKKPNGAGGPFPNARPDRRDPQRQKESRSAEEEPLTWFAAPAKSKKDKKLAHDDGDIDIQNDLSTIVKTKKLAMNGRSTRAGVADTEDAIAQGASASVGNTDGWTTVSYKQGSEDPPSDSESETENPLQTQRSELHRRAFAGDDVHLAFDKEKEEAAASEDEKETSTHLPGWGSWTGTGLSKSIRKANARQRHNPLFKTKLPGGTAPSARQDRKLENVIISERQDRKGKKYLASQLPHQFAKEDAGWGGKELYERSLRVPVGPEWTTKEVFQRNTRPRVVVGRGRVVEAMERPMV